MPRLPPAALRQKLLRTAKSMTEKQASKKMSEDNPASTKGEQPRRPNQYKTASKILNASSNMMSKVDANAKILGIAYSANKYGVKTTLKRLSDSYILQDKGEKSKKGKECDPEKAEIMLSEILFIARNLQELATTQTGNTRLPRASRLPWVRKESASDPSSQPGNEEIVKANPQVETQETVEQTNEPKEHPSSQPENEANSHVETQERVEHTDEPNESDEDSLLSSVWSFICNFISQWFDN